MSKVLNKVVLGALTVTTLGIAAPVVSEAATVWYKDTAVSWNHGRSLGVTSYSTVQSSYYDHSTTANTTFSGWKKPGVQAHAQQWVGTGSATAYWNVRG